jgi:hypothetical protein
MAKQPTIDHRVADRRREAVPARAADDRHRIGRHGANDFMLVLGMAAVVLGVVMVSQGVLPSPPAVHLVPRAHAALMPAESAGPAPEERLAAYTSPTTSVPPTSAPRTASRGATGLVTACPAHFDLRQVLAAMALQGQRYARAYPAAHFRPPRKGDVPASVLILAEGSSVAAAEASPPAVELPRGPGC